MAVNLDNSDKRLIEGVVNILRDNVSGWSTSSEYGVNNVWPSQPPTSVEDEFPRGIVDVISGEDSDLSVDLDVSLREVIVRVTVFSESQSNIYDLVDDSEDAVVTYWDQTDSWTGYGDGYGDAYGGSGTVYSGDWTYRQVDGFAETNESEGVEGNLRYSRYRDFVFEVPKVN